MSLEWSPQQDDALMAIERWRRSQDEQVFRVFGFAGTGKTTLARHVAEGCDGPVLFAAYTGKAAHVMRTKGCHDASTIHSLIYRASDVFVCRDHPEVEENFSTCCICGKLLHRRVSSSSTATAASAMPASSSSTSAPWSTR